MLSNPPTIKMIVFYMVCLNLARGGAVQALSPLLHENVEVPPSSDVVGDPACAAEWLSLHA